VTPRRALDADVDSILQIRAGGLNILNVVDSWIDEETLQLLSAEAPWDLILWPFQTMREIEVLSPSRAASIAPEIPSEWISQLQVLKPKFIVPSSCQFQMEDWSWYNHAFFPITYRQFQREIEAALPETQVIRLNPSVSVNLTHEACEFSTPLPWVEPIGEQDVDYVYRPNEPAPTTAEIARHFSPLSSEQQERILSYCQTGLLEKFRSIEASDDPYFRKPRHWRLSIFDHQGRATVFHYQIHKTQIESIHENDGPLAWTTEVPIAKLFAALELGESLTSMYLRMNDQKFEPAIEDEIQNVDMIEDPLIRCLFHGAFGAYQIAQLRRIRNGGANES
jgi:hypothetical protein